MYTLITTKGGLFAIVLLKLYTLSISSREW
jgi:hypothetical protein